MNYILIGKIVNTHGIKGELRIISDFPYKDRVFKNNFNIYIGKDKINEVINTYRHHKIFDMITLKNYNNINEVLKYKGSLVYINRLDLQLNDNEYLESDLLNFDIIINNNIIGKLSSFENHNKNKIIIVKNKEKEILLPYNSNLIENINLDKKEIIYKNIEGLI
ncbi:MAG: ribosome maturation factor RimM [Tenericutes bacterium]|nr:ribosome maturation factor RimM [Mycoplasmatota bacterium]